MTPPNLWRVWKSTTTPRENGSVTTSLWSSGPERRCVPPAFQLMVLTQPLCESSVWRRDIRCSKDTDSEKKEWVVER